MKSTSLYFAALMFASISVSCVDDNAEEQLTDRQLLSALAVIDYTSETDFQLAMDSANDSGSMRTGTQQNTVAPCAEFTIEAGTNNGYPKVLTIDYGVGCLHNGISRSGILTITLTGPVLEAGSEMTIARSNYFVNGYKVEGTVHFINQTSDLQVPQWQRTINDGKITTPAGLVYTHAGTRSVRQISGVQSPFVLADNVYEITSGTHQISGPNDGELTVNVIATLTKEFSCQYISQGVLDLQGVFLNGTLDYGSGSCDNDAIYTHSDGETYDINL